MPYYGRPVYQVPSAWDYVAEGLGTGVEAYQGAKSRRLQEAERKRERERQEDMQMLQLLMNAYNTGSIDSGTVNAFAQSKGIPFQVQPSPQETRRQIELQPEGQLDLQSLMNLPTPGPMQPPDLGEMQRGLEVGAGPLGAPAAPSLMQPFAAPAVPRIEGIKPPTARRIPWTEAQLKMAGLPTEIEKLEEHLRKAKATAGLKFLGVEPGEVTPAETELITGKTPAERKAAEAELADRTMVPIAERYVAGAINLARSNKANPFSNPSRLADVAFRTYMSDRQTEGRPLTLEETRAARAYFEAAVQDEYGKWYEAQTRRAAMETRDEAQLVAKLRVLVQENNNFLSKYKTELAYAPELLEAKAKADKTFGAAYSNYKNNLKQINSLKTDLGLPVEPEEEAAPTLVPLSKEKMKEYYDALKNYSTDEIKRRLDAAVSGGAMSEEDRRKLLAKLGL